MSAKTHSLARRLAVAAPLSTTSCPQPKIDSDTMVSQETSIKQVFKFFLPYKYIYLRISR